MIQQNDKNIPNDTTGREIPSDTGREILAAASPYVDDRRPPIFPVTHLGDFPTFLENKAVQPLEEIAEENNCFVIVETTATPRPLSQQTEIEAQDNHT